MTHHRPDIPQKLAKRIGLAQFKVTRAYEYLATMEQRIRTDEARYLEFTTDPFAFAARHYPGHGIDSYPVVTNTSRLREATDSRIASRPRRWAAIHDAEETLAGIEAEVLAEVTSMRPSKGRVPWPAPIAGYEEVRARCDAEWEVILAETAANLIIRNAENEREYQEEMAENLRLTDLEDEEERLRVAAMSPEEQADRRREFRIFKEEVDAGRITILGYLYEQQDSARDERGDYPMTRELDDALRNPSR